MDQLLNSSLPHDLLNEYTNVVPNGDSHNLSIPPLILETCGSSNNALPAKEYPTTGSAVKKVKRTPRDIYTVTETTPLVQEEDGLGPVPNIPGLEVDNVEIGDRIVKVAIYVNLLANVVLLAGKIIVIILTSSLSVLASLVDAALDL